MRLRRLRVPWVLLLTVIGSLAGQAAHASASSFTINPTQVTLTARATSALLTLRNETNAPLRFQISVFRWDQTPEGEMKLDATRDIVFFPALLTLEAGQERRIRVGTTTSFGAVEKTYRLFVEELPPQQKDPAEQGVRVLTKMGLPIFLQPPKPAAQAALADLAASRGRFTFRIRNTGNTHFIPQSIRVAGTTAGGQRVFDREINGWYILAGGSRVFDLELPGAVCRQIATLAVDVAIEPATLSERLQVQPAACQP